MIELALFWTAFFALAIFLAVVGCFVVHLFRWERFFVPSYGDEEFSEDHGRSRIGMD